MGPCRVPPVTTNQAALVITAADLRITVHPLGPPGRYRHRVASRAGGRSRYAFGDSPTMAWIGGRGLSPATTHVTLGVRSCPVKDPKRRSGHRQPELRTLVKTHPQPLRPARATSSGDLVLHR